jgi:hypothetical protein
MAGEDTVRVVPFEVRRAGDAAVDVGDSLTCTGRGLRGWSGAVKAIGGWRSAGAYRTQVANWEAYLGRLGSTVSRYGEHLRKVADAYERCDREAAEALGVGLPADGPSDVRTRPGRVPA